MTSQNGSTISNVTLSSNNMTITWTNNTPNEYTFQNHYIYLLSSRSQFSGTSLPTEGAPGTLVPYEVPTTVQYLSPPGQLNGYNVNSFNVDAGTYTIGGLPPGTYNVLLVTNYNGYKNANNTLSPPTFIGAFWPNPITVPILNTAVSIPQLISVSTDNYSFIKFTQKASLYNGTYPATSYTYYAVNSNTQTLTVTVQPTLDSYGNQYYAWPITKTGSGSSIPLGGQWSFSFSASYTSPSTGTINSGISDVTQVYNLVDKVPETPTNLQAIYSRTTGFTGALHGVEPSSVKLTWDADPNRYGDPVVSYNVTVNYDYFNRNYVFNYYTDHTVYLPPSAPQSSVITVTPKPDGNSLTFDATNLYGINPDPQLNNGYIYASFEHGKSYTFSVVAKDAKGKTSPVTSITVLNPAFNQPRSIQSVGVYKVNPVFPPTQSYAIPVTLVQNQSSQYVNPSYFLVYWSPLNSPVPVQDNLITFAKYYAGFANQGAVYNSSGYITSSTVYVNGGFPTNTAILKFGVVSAYVYTDSNGVTQTNYGDMQWTQNVKNL